MDGAMVNEDNAEIQKVICSYCNNEIKPEEFKSDFESTIHYKTQICPTCKKEQRIQVSFAGDGNDTWNGKEPKITQTKSKEKYSIRTLEGKIKVIGEAKN